MLRRSLRLEIVTALSLLSLTGCSSQGIKTYPVNGKVEIKDGDVAVLAQSDVELMHENDQFLRATGNIGPEGDFTVETLYQGEILPGAPEGKYKARIVLADESDEGVPKRKGEVIHRRFLNFESSGLSITVPSDDYTIVLSRK